MQYNRESGNALLDLFEDVETERRRDEHAISIAGALVGLELGGTVRGPDGDGEENQRRSS